jgi:tetratricopeptide (TPR) repeat protein
VSCVDDNVLVAYARGDMSGDERQAVERHFDGCETCRRVAAAVASDLGVAAPAEPTRTVAEDAPPPPTALVPGEVLGGRFRLTRVLGKGGMGVVYAADDLTLGVTVALKVLGSHLTGGGSFERALENEVVSARRVTHRNVCRVYDVGTSGRHCFLTMELIEGTSLDKVLGRGPMPTKEAARVFAEIAAGLAAAHDRGITHRDLKPGNVMLDARGTAKLMDFGIASESHQEGGEASPAGTPSYMAPEQARGAPARPPADIYSAGVIGFRLFTGRPSAEVHDAAARALVPARFRRVISRCLEVSPEARFADGAALLEAIERARRLPRVVAAAVGLLLVCALAAGAALRSSRAPTTDERLRAAFVDLERGRIEAASASLASVLKDEPRSPDALFGSALLAWWRDASLTSSTAGAAQAALAVPQSPARQVTLRALVPLSEHRWSDALALVAAQPVGGDDEPWLDYARFEALYHGGRPRDALAPYLAIVARRPDFRLAWDHLVDYALATFDARALEAIERNTWLRDDPYFSTYAVVVTQWRSGPAEALPLTEKRQPDEVDVGHSPALQALRLKLLALAGRPVEAAQALADARALNPMPTMDDVGLYQALGRAAQALLARQQVLAQFSRGAVPEVEFRFRAELWVQARFRQGREALDAEATAARALPVLDRDRLINHRMLRALSLPDEGLSPLADDAAPAVAAVVRARRAEAQARWAEAAAAWGEALAQSLDDRWAHLLRVFAARAHAQAGERDRAVEVCRPELAPVSLKGWSLFPARAECALLTAEVLLGGGRAREAGEALSALRRERAADADDEVQRALEALEARGARP